MWTASNVLLMKRFSKRRACNRAAKARFDDVAIGLDFKSALSGSNAEVISGMARRRSVEKTMHSCKSAGETAEDFFQMFDRFTDRARKVMSFARQEAERFN